MKLFLWSGVEWNESDCLEVFPIVQSWNIALFSQEFAKKKCSDLIHSSWQFEKWKTVTEFGTIFYLSCGFANFKDIYIHILLGCTRKIVF